MTTHQNYRWNTSDFAVGYDASAQTVHPHYREIQDAILAGLSLASDATSLVVDLGGGSGRLVERVLDRWPGASGLVLDQSEAFLALAERRLARFGPRAACVKARLQDDFPSLLPQQPAAIVSMSAIHHLEPAEKQDVYRRCHEALVPGGLLLNGDEVRPAADDAYLAELQAWADHMLRSIAAGAVADVFHPALHTWIERNVSRFGQPKHSGDDCHETIQTQLDYLRSAGFDSADCPWHKALWAVLRAVKAA
jgi:tRNA (cmo5U34)-methyltransferase